MKNLMDFCIGTVVFIVIGFSLLLGEDLFGLLENLDLIFLQLMIISIFQVLYLI